MPRLVTTLGVGLALLLPAQATAAPATPEFLATWKKADQLYANWDLIAAERTFLADLPAAQQKELAGLLRRLLAPFGG